MKSYLPRLMATITSHPRYDSHAQWDKNIWIANIFRAWEKVFGRRSGIRAEMSSSTHEINGEQVVNYTIYTFEALFSYIEMCLRELLAKKILPFKLVQINFAPNINNTKKFGIPGLHFAIALDVASVGTNTVTTPITWSHTCTGSNGILFVFGALATSISPTISTPTYNSVSMSLVGSQQTLTGGGNKLALYLLTGPSTGANTISMAFGGTSPKCNGSACSYSGAAQAGQPDATAGNIGTSANPSLTVATIANNCWCIGACQNTASANSITAGLTSREAFSYGSANSNANLQDTNGVVTPAGNKTVNWTMTSTNWGAEAASFSPASAYTNQFFAFFRP